MKKVLVFFIVLSFNFVMAQQSNFNRSMISHSTSSYLVEDGLDNKSGIGIEKNIFFGLMYDYVENPYIVTDNNTGNKKFDAVTDFTRIRTSFGFMPTANLYLGLSVPFDNVTHKLYVPGTNDINIQTKPYISTSSLGDISAILKWRMVNIAHSWNWTLNFDFTTATGDTSAFNTDTSNGYGIGASFTKYMGQGHKWRTWGNLGGRYAPDSKIRLAKIYTEFDASIRFNLGIGISREVNPWLRAYFEAKGFVALPFDEGENPVEISMGLDLFYNKDFNLYAGYGLEALAGDSFANDMRYFAGIKYAFGNKRNFSSNQEVVEASNVPTSESLQNWRIQGQPGLSSILFRLGNMEFIKGSAEILPHYKPLLVQLSSLLVKYKSYLKPINIIGYTDSIGNEKFNQKLSIKRAEVVAQFLVKHGVSSSLIKTQGMGENDLLIKERDVRSHQMNRRVQIKLEGFRHVLYK